MRRDDTQVDSTDVNCGYGRVLYHSYIFFIVVGLYYFCGMSFYFGVSCSRDAGNARGGLPITETVSVAREN